MTVLVLARNFDPTADAVVTALAERQVPVFRTNLAAFPRHLRLDAWLRGGRWTGHLGNDHHSVALEDIRSIWHRNPGRYVFEEVAARRAAGVLLHRSEARVGRGTRVAGRAVG